MKAPGLIAAAAALGIVLASAPLAASQAHAETPTSVTFATDAITVAEFGADWVVELAVSHQYDYCYDDCGPGNPGSSTAAAPTAGTVDVYLSGIGGAFAKDLPIQTDGTVYFAQPLDQPLLAAGAYGVTAIFNPALGSNLASSQTSAAATLEITALELVAGLDVTIDPAISTHPVVTLDFTGDWLKSRGGAPAGVWTVAVTTTAPSKVLFETSVAQKSGSTTPVLVEIPARLADETTYSVSATFTPVESIAGGIQLKNPSPASFTTPGTTFTELVATRVPVPWWSVLAVGVLMLGLVATLVVLVIRISRPRDSIARAPQPDSAVDEASDDNADAEESVDTEPDSLTHGTTDAGPGLPTEPETPRSKSLWRKKP